ncbi:MAG TPA: bifunctional nuclease domain-containing protein [Chitinophagales bacterium]|nr:bifunctional nuclease domain-containing protein [Chitinophagales bacterium]
MMNKIPLEIITITTSVSQNNSFVVILAEPKGKRRLPIVVGNTEAQSIVVAMERMNPKRPLTHDLMKNLMMTYDIQLKEVIVSRVIEGIFFSQLVCERNGQEEVIDSRTSDAIALAIRFNCPIFTYTSIMDSVGVELEVFEEEVDMESDDEIFEASTVDNPVSDWSMYSAGELEKLLNDSLEKEEYEKAAFIRDEIDKRKAS